MKPAPFAYVKPASLAEVFRILAAAGDGARLLAGGQSLMPSLNLRLSAPEVLVDINGLPGLRGIVLRGDRLRIGALTRHVEVEHSELVRRHAPLIAAAMPHIAHPAIRNRGTFGGSIALADPAAELPACVLALDGEMEIAGSAGTRRVAAGDFFRGLYETAVGAGEVLTAVEVPTQQPDWRSTFAELARRHGDYAMAGIAAQGWIDGDRARALRLVFFGVGLQPMRAVQTETVLTGQRITRDIVGAAQAALGQDLQPVGDIQAGGATKLHLARVLLARALASLARQDP